MNNATTDQTAASMGDAASDKVERKKTCSILIIAKDPEVEGLMQILRDSHGQRVGRGCIYNFMFRAVGGRNMKSSFAPARFGRSVCGEGA